MAALAKREANEAIEERDNGKELKYDYQVNTNILIGKLKVFSARGFSSKGGADVFLDAITLQPKYYCRSSRRLTLRKPAPNHSFRIVVFSSQLLRVCTIILH